ncbi:hypothetical protein [Sporosarcina aquimarina]|uniref:hypothetical protein n=1 Tax=Sporosarcina aquimarina TaxID=114975 RepID=UPI00295F5667|nr:hypothetical protein [Sporosarcina aquimarina]
MEGLFVLGSGSKIVFYKMIKTICYRGQMVFVNAYWETTPLSGNGDMNNRTKFTIGNKVSFVYQLQISVSL